MVFDGLMEPLLRCPPKLSNYSIPKSNEGTSPTDTLRLGSYFAHRQGL